VIGKEGSSDSGAMFVQELWKAANGNFEEVSALAQRTETGALVGIWGAMTDFSRSFRPWEDGFTRGLYLAGVECRDDADAPEGWVRWDIPGFEYIRIPNNVENAFVQGLQWLEEQGLPLVGAVQDFTDPVTGMNYIMYPVARL